MSVRKSDVLFYVVHVTPNRILVFLKKKQGRMFVIRQSFANNFHLLRVQIFVILLKCP